MEDGMSKTKKMPKSLFLGRWRIVSMSTWNEDYINEEFPAFIEFDDKGDGSSQFAYVRGAIDYRITTRDGEPAVEWSWEGNAAARGQTPRLPDPKCISSQPSKAWDFGHYTTLPGKNTLPGWDEADLSF